MKLSTISTSFQFIIMMISTTGMGLAILVVGGTIKEVNLIMKSFITFSVTTGIIFMVASFVYFNFFAHHSDEPTEHKNPEPTSRSNG